MDRLESMHASVIMNMSAFRVADARRGAEDRFFAIVLETVVCLF